MVNRLNFWNPVYSRYPVIQYPVSSIQYPASSIQHPSEPAGIYVHIPFCIQKCSYCDFYSITDTSPRSAFIDALVHEMHLKSNFAEKFDTLYIGGGTPSVFDAVTIGRIIAAARRSFQILADAEITLEVNPGTLSAEDFDGYRSAGINRLSIGVQSFNPLNLDFLGRIHTSSDASMAVQRARDAGFENLSLDLIYGIPGQTATAWIKDLQRALEFEPAHLSCYMLTYEPGTPLDAGRQKGRFRPLPEGDVSNLFEVTAAVLDSRGYAQYEISSFARTGPGRSGKGRCGQNRSRHNRKYWSFVSYLGLGPSAHSFKEPMRCWNQPHVNHYIKALAAGRFPPAAKEVLSRSQLMIEAIYLGLRQTEGICLEAFAEKFGLSFKRRFGDTLQDLKDRGLIRFKNCCALTRQGLLLLDSIVSMLVNQI